MNNVNNALEIRNLSKRYEDFQLDHINLMVPAGAIVGLIGENGAGKSTTIKAVMNLIHKDSGDITIYGQHLEDNPQKLKEEISVVFDDIHFNKNFNAKEIAAICRGIYKNWDENRWNELMKWFCQPVSKPVKDFSKGMRVKLNLAIALSHRAELLILDEPTSGLDPVSRSELLDIFSYLKEKGAAVFFSTHITSDLEKCADDITYIKHGRIIYTGTMADLISSASERGEGNTLEEIMVQSEKEDLHEKLG